MKISQINEKYNSRAKNHCNIKIALLSTLVQLNSFGKKFLAPKPKILVTAVVNSYRFNNDLYIS
jgi:hypothetical protein